MKDKRKYRKWINVTDEASLHLEMGDDSLTKDCMRICLYHKGFMVGILYSSPQDKSLGKNPYFVTLNPREYKLVLSKTFNTYFKLMYKKENA